jgi:hypothetical protein
MDDLIHGRPLIFLTVSERFTSASKRFRTVFKPKKLRNGQNIFMELVKLSREINATVLHTTVLERGFSEIRKTSDKN